MVREAVQPDRSISEIGRLSSVNQDQLSQWIREYKVDDILEYHCVCDNISRSCQGYARWMLTLKLSLQIHHSMGRGLRVTNSSASKLKVKPQFFSNSCRQSLGEIISIQSELTCRQAGRCGSCYIQSLDLSGTAYTRKILQSFS